MLGFFKKDQKEFKPFDIYLLFTTLLLVFIGIVMIFSSSAVFALEIYGDKYFFLKRQLLFAGAGIVIMFLISSIPYRAYLKFVYPFLLFNFFLLILVRIWGHGGSSEGVYRWIRLGPISFQPSEMAKISVILFVAYALAKKKEKVRDFKVGFLPVLILSGIFIGLILAGRDLGSAFTLGLITFAMIFISGTRLRYLVGAILLSLPILYYFIFAVDFRRQRILAFLDPP